MRHLVILIASLAAAPSSAADLIIRAPVQGAVMQQAGAPAACPDDAAAPAGSGCTALSPQFVLDSAPSICPGNGAAPADGCMADSAQFIYDSARVTPPGSYDGTPRASCADHLAADPSAGSGSYEITTSSGTLAVQCDMRTDGGGWTLVMIGNGEKPAMKSGGTSSAWSANTGAYDVGELDDLAGSSAKLADSDINAIADALFRVDTRAPPGELSLYFNATSCNYDHARRVPADDPCGTFYFDAEAALSQSRPVAVSTYNAGHGGLIAWRDVPGMPRYSWVVTSHSGNDWHYHVGVGWTSYYGSTRNHNEDGFPTTETGSYRLWAR